MRNPLKVFRTGREIQAGHMMMVPGSTSIIALCSLFDRQEPIMFRNDRPGPVDFGQMWRTPVMMAVHLAQCWGQPLDHKQQPNHSRIQGALDAGSPLIWGLSVVNGAEAKDATPETVHVWEAQYKCNLLGSFQKRGNKVHLHSPITT